MRKKFAVRFLTTALALGMSVSMMAVSAAAAVPVKGIIGLTDDLNAKLNGADIYSPQFDTGYVVTDKTGAYVDADKVLNQLNGGGNRPYREEHRMLDFGGADTWDFIGMGVPSSASANNGVYKMYVKSTDAAGGLTEWDKVYGDGLVFMFAPHVHRIPVDAPWYGDNNNHWKICPQCNEFAMMNWHHDVDNNGVCDQCGLDIVYRYVTVKDSVGGTVKASIEKGMLGNRVSVTVTPDPGYKLSSLRAQNDNGKSYSIRPCFEDVKGSEYHFFLDVWDVELNAEFVQE